MPKKVLHASFVWTMSLGLLAIVVSLLIVDLPSADTISAQGPATPLELHGWGWSSQVGWVLFDPVCPPEIGLCDGVKVKTTIPRTFFGYTWINPRYDDGTSQSDNIGYVRFDPPGPYPTGINTADFSARFDPTDTNNELIEGWARACSVFVNGCGGAMDNADLKPNNERGGWDGWLSLRGEIDCGTPPCPGYGIKRQSARLIGYAWGGDVIGWLQFGPRCDFDGDGVATNNCGAGVTITQVSGLFDYALTVIPTEQTVIGLLSPASFDVVVTHLTGLAQEVSLKLDDYPAGTGFNFLPSNICTVTQVGSIGDSCSRKLTINNLPYGDYDLRIISRASPMTLADKEVPIVIHVSNPPPAPVVDIKANSSDGPLTVAPGQRVGLVWTFNLNGATGGTCDLYKDTTKVKNNVSVDNAAGSNYETPGIIVNTTYKVVCNYTGTLPEQANTSLDTVIINARKRSYEEF